MKKVLSILLMLSLIVTLFVGCGNNNTTKQNSNSTSEKQGEMAESTDKTGNEALSGKIIVATQADTTQSQWHKKNIEMFRKANPEVEVVHEEVSGDYMQMLQQRFVANDAPDVFYLDVAQAQGLIATNSIQSLDEYIEKNHYDLSDFIPTLLDFYRSNDKLYGIPIDYNMLGLFYNKAMFEKENLEPPTNWEELKETAKKLTGDGVFGLSLQNEIARFHPFAVQNGATIMKEGAKGPIVNSPEFIEAVEFWISLFQEGIATTPQDIGENWDGDVFGKGLAAMTVEGGWLCKYMQNQYPDIDYGVVVLPSHKEKSTLTFCNAWAMPASSENKEAAFAYIMSASSPEGQKFQFPDQNAIPSRKSLAKEYLKLYPAWEAFTKQADYAQPYYYGLVGPTTNTELTNALTEIKDGTSNAKTALDGAQKRINAALDDMIQ